MRGEEDKGRRVSKQQCIDWLVLGVCTCVIDGSGGRVVCNIEEDQEERLRKCVECKCGRDIERANGFLVGAARAGGARSAAQPPGSRAEAAGNDETLHDTEEQVRQRVRSIAGCRDPAGSQDRPDR